MKKVWIVLANSCGASIYVASEKDRDLNLITRYSHEEGRLKNIDLVSDRPGHFEKGSDTHRGSYASDTDPKHKKIEQFAKELCQELEISRISKAYTSLIIVAEPHFFGLMNKQASHEVKKLLTHHLLKDYSHYSEKELKLHLKTLLKYEITEDLIV